MNSHGASHRRSPAILVVDDDPDVLSFVVATLRRCGFTVYEASTPRHAIEVFGKHKTSIGVLLADVMMDDLRGPELGTLLKERKPELELLFMTGYRGYRIAGLEDILEDAGTLSKPFTPVELVNAIETLCSRASRSVAAPAQPNASSQSLPG